MAEKVTSVKVWFDEVFPKKFDPKATGGFQGTFQFNIPGDDGGEWTTTFAGDAMQVTEGLSGEPEFSITMKDENFLKMMNGELNGQMAFMSGKLKFKGSMSVAMKLKGLLF